MKKGILLTILAAMLFQFAAVAQNYDRYNFFHEEALKLKNEGKLDEAKEKFKKIKVICKGGIPADNDLDRMIRECTTINLSENSIQFNARDNKSKSITVKTNSESFKASSNAKWCKVGKKGNVVTVSCDNNDTPNSRNATIAVSADGKTVSISVLQHGGELEFDLHPDSVYFSKTGESVGVTISTNAPSWRVDSVPYWIDWQVRDDVLYLRTTQNELASARRATLYVIAFDDRFPIYVSQAGSDTTLVSDREEMVFPCTESTDQFTITSNLNQWRVWSSDEWIHVSVSQDTVNVKVRPNESLFSRHGWVRVELGQRFCVVPVHQYASSSAPPTVESEIKNDGTTSKGTVAIKSVPSDLKVTIIDDAGESNVRYTPFDMPIDYGHYSLLMGFERREVFANEQQPDVVFEPGLRFATLTWAPKAGFGMMSGYVGAKSWGAYTHFQVRTPFVTDFSLGNEGIAGYNMVFGPVFRHNDFPYLGAYAGVGLGAYEKEPHFGIDYEAGLMGFYKNVMLTAGFHTSRVIKSVHSTSFVLGVGGYLKRYYDADMGYCANDSRRWISVNYVFRPSENGKGVMVGDLGSDAVRIYLKALYMSSGPASDSLAIKNLEGGGGLIFTPVNGIIDMCLGVSAQANLKGLEDRFQGIGVELGTVLNIWRFPITIFLHEADLFGDRHLCVDFGIGFHLGEFGKSKCSYQ